MASRGAGTIAGSATPIDCVPAFACVPAFRAGGTGVAEGAGSRFAVLFESVAPLSHARAAMAVASTSIGKRIELSSPRIIPEQDDAAGGAKHVACHRAAIHEPVDPGPKTTNKSRCLQRISNPWRTAEGTFAYRRAEFAQRRMQVLR
jgi:hypothetical protein